MHIHCKGHLNKYGSQITLLINVKYLRNETLKTVHKFNFGQSPSQEMDVHAHIQVNMIRAEVSDTFGLLGIIQSNCL